ncbi:MAG: hypothetical protein JXA03_14670, partial [Bacteroidales bacterium]|nr:hypothetical protein [Bacteroidales bacterium]
MDHFLHRVFIILALTVSFSCSNNADKEAWENCKSINTIEAYSQYLSEYPQGKHVKDANDS